MAVMTDLLGYAASFAVLATFLMRSMAALRLTAILSNILFIAFGYLRGIHPVLLLHLALLPINVWRLFAAENGAAVPSRILRSIGLPPHGLWSALGLFAGLWKPLAVILMAALPRV